MLEHTCYARKQIINRIEIKGSSVTIFMTELKTQNGLGESIIESIVKIKEMKNLNETKMEQTQPE